MKKIEIWNRVGQGSRVLWKTATGEVVTATVVEFWRAESALRVIPDDEKDKAYAVWIENIVGVEIDGKMVEIA